jgi:AcrR family transcriptional regulator
MIRRVPRTRATRRPRPRKASVLPPPPHPPRGAEVTGEKLLQATHELLYERAGEEPSVSQICERADVRVAMVSYCFGGKAQLLDALVERAVDGIMAEQAELVARDLPPEEALAVQVEATVRNFVRYPYMSSLSERLAAGDRTAGRMAASFVDPTLGFYRDTVAAGVAAGTFRPVDATLLFFSIVGMCEFLFAARSWLTHAGETLDDALVDRFAEHTVELVLQGLTPVAA